MLDGISQLPEIRYERVEEIRRQIAAGSYETPEKLELALDRLFDELRGW
jgi:negative regulator of flagellin synthesis FlgM